jgi:hypothetical protein
MQPDDLLRKIARQEASVYSELGSGAAEKVGMYLQQLKDLAENRNLVLKEYPIWPFPASAMRRYALFALATIPVILSAILGVMESWQAVVQDLL